MTGFGIRGAFRGGGGDDRGRQSHQRDTGQWIERIGEERQKALLIDADLTLDEITPNFLKVLEQFSPFGFANREPLFAATGCRLVGKPKLLRKRHVKFTVRGERGSSFEVIAFDRSDIFTDLETCKAAQTLQLACIPERNQWNGREYVQLRLKDFAVSE